MSGPSTAWWFILARLTLQRYVAEAEKESSSRGCDGAHVVGGTGADRC